MTLSIAKIVSSALVVIAGCAGAESAWALGACSDALVRKGGWIVDVSYRPASAGVASQLDYVTTSISHMASASGFVDEAGGIAQVRDGTSNTVFFAERLPALVSCDDVNRDGVAGIAVVRFSLRDAQSGAIVSVAIVPHDGELDHPGEETVTIVVGGAAVTATATVHEWVFGTERPR